MPTGWRPSDVETKYPVYAIEDVYGYNKFNPKSSLALHLWSWGQFLVTFLLMMYLFNSIGDLTFDLSLAYGLFLGVMIFNYTTLMDRSSYAWLTAAIQLLIGLGIILFQKDWFLLNNHFTFGSLMVAIYLLLAFAITTYFQLAEINPERKKLTLTV